MFKNQICWWNFEENPASIPKPVKYPQIKLKITKVDVAAVWTWSSFVLNGHVVAYDSSCDERHSVIKVVDFNSFNRFQ